MTLHWGIASAGKISHDFVSAVKLLPQNDHKVIAVAARDINKAKEFSALHSIQNAYQGYDQLAKDPSIDIVYIGMLNPQHYEVAKLMLENDKHVLCEKPLCMNYKQAKSLIDFAREKKKFLMEAVWSRCFPLYDAINKYIESGDLGEIMQVHAEFGVKIEHVDRLNTRKLGGGTILDIGVYCLQFAQMVYKTEPKTIVASGYLNNDGVDLSMSCVLTYPNGGTAVLSTHSRVELENEAIIIGTKGSLKIDKLWCPTKLRLPDGTWKEFPLPTGGTFNFHNSAGLNFEAEECRKCIAKGLLESPKVSHSDSLGLAKLEDTIRKQIGVHYDQDED